MDYSNILKNDEHAAWWQANEAAWTRARQLLTYAHTALLVSPPGTGKTRLAATYNLASRPVYSTTLGTFATRADLFGMPDLHHAGAWQDGPVVLGMRNGGRVVLNEVNRPETDAVAAILQACDMADAAQTGRPDATITLLNGQAVTAQPGLQVVATSNGGLDTLDPALADRMAGCTVELPGPAPEAMGYLLSRDERVGAAALRNVAETEYQGDRLVPLRSWLMLVQCYLPNLDLPTACDLAFGTRGPDIYAALQLGVA